MFMAAAFRAATGRLPAFCGDLPVAALNFKSPALNFKVRTLNFKSAYSCQSFALKGQYIPARRIAAGSVAQEINAL
jgi:hypothetical protein